MNPCACGCGRPVSEPRRKFASRECYFGAMRKPGSVYCALLTVEARQKSIEVRLKRASRRAEHLPSKAVAYARGYVVGYNRAYRYFKNKFGKAS